MSAFALMLLLHRVPGKWFSKARAQVNFGELGNNTDMGVTGGGRQVSRGHYIQGWDINQPSLSLPLTSKGSTFINNLNSLICN